MDNKCYIIVGSNNKWYGTYKTLIEIINGVEELKNDKYIELPETLYVYKSEEIKRINLV